MTTDCEYRHVDADGALVRATTRVYWLEPGVAEDAPALAEAELCDAHRDYAVEPWARMGALTWVDPVPSEPTAGPAEPEGESAVRSAGAEAGSPEEATS